MLPGSEGRDAREWYIEFLRSENAKLRANIASAQKDRIARLGANGGSSAAAALAMSAVRSISALGRLAMWPRTIAPDLDSAAAMPPQSTMRVTVGSMFKTNAPVMRAAGHHAGGVSAPAQPGFSVSAALSRHVWGGESKPPPIPAQLKAAGLSASTARPTESSPGAAGWAYCVSLTLQLRDEGHCAPVIEAILRCPPPPSVTLTVRTEHLVEASSLCSFSSWLC